MAALEQAAETRDASNLRLGQIHAGGFGHEYDNHDNRD
jgi:hypothetical protein